MSARRILVATTVAVTAVVLMAASTEAQPAARRFGNQQLRIAQGIRSGALTAREAVRLERREAALAHEVRHLRHSDGGALSPAHRLLVNHQHHQLSRRIFHQKHDRQHRR
jgi:hypothetical protein